MAGFSVSLDPRDRQPAGNTMILNSIIAVGIVLTIIFGLFLLDGGTYERMHRECAERGMKHVHPGRGIYFCKDAEGRLYEQGPKPVPHSTERSEG